MQSHKDNILNRLVYLFTILQNNNIIIDNLPNDLHTFKISKLLNLESQILNIMNERKIDINNINTRQIYKNVKGNERINILTELKKYLNMISDKTNYIYIRTNALIKYIENNKILDKKILEVEINKILI